jgi:hypothetical protein
MLRAPGKRLEAKLDLWWPARAWFCASKLFLGSRGSMGQALDTSFVVMVWGMKLEACPSALQAPRGAKMKLKGRVGKEQPPRDYSDAACNVAVARRCFLLRPNFPFFGRLRTQFFTTGPTCKRKTSSCQMVIHTQLLRWSHLTHKRRRTRPRSKIRLSRFFSFGAQSVGLGRLSRGCS